MDLPASRPNTASYQIVTLVQFLYHQLRRMLVRSVRPMPIPGRVENPHWGMAMKEQKTMILGLCLSILCSGIALAGGAVSGDALAEKVHTAISAKDVEAISEQWGEGTFEDV